MRKANLRQVPRNQPGRRTMQTMRESQDAHPSKKGVLHDAGSRVGRIDGRQVWYLYIISWIVRLFTGFFR